MATRDSDGSRPCRFQVPIIGQRACGRSVASARAHPRRMPNVPRSMPARSRAEAMPWKPAASSSARTSAAWSCGGREHDFVVARGDRLPRVHFATLAANVPPAWSRGNHYDGNIVSQVVSAHLAGFAAGRRDLFKSSRIDLQRVPSPHRKRVAARTHRKTSRVKSTPRRGWRAPASHCAIARSMRCESPGEGIAASPSARRIACGSIAARVTLR